MGNRCNQLQFAAYATSTVEALGISVGSHCENLLNMAGSKTGRAGVITVPKPDDLTDEPPSSWEFSRRVCSGALKVTAESTDESGGAGRHSD
eukprot:CAMPEP_0204407508 /NCGR_PEP_ID=MMETSP0470-20130426/8805_1 /ASSEMBLY_ACC=CAM_ASM_000385 /TAXON_ID=2969 /ORGANISM="Oxyrrhis marina" /LENGTH=91 /DNA_ID=CAMNT_0051403167 /DNA_START=123 /DNA_END=396 /DNA_ORIENTATION=+